MSEQVPEMAVFHDHETGYIRVGPADGSPLTLDQALALVNATHHPARVLLSVEDAKAEAQRRWPDYPHVGFSGADDRQQAFIEGAKWALDQAPTVQQAWDEGRAAAVRDNLAWNFSDPRAPETRNPYRARAAETEGE